MQGKLAEVKREYVQALEKKGIKTLETGVESMLRIVLKGALSSQLRE